MPKNKKERRIFALISVLITVPCFVLYCLIIENGGLSNINPAQFFLFVAIELVIAWTAAYFIGTPLALKITFKKVNPKKTSHKVVQTLIVISTVCIMCPLMSVLATILYQGIFPGIIYHDVTFKLSSFIINFIPNLLKTIIQNFPFALITQLFFIQPCVRKIFSFAYSK